jgi:protoporphyrinogen oxidase
VKKNTIIIGGGIAGLLSAFILSKNKNHNIHIVEQKDMLGGLYGYFDYGKYGRFDYGAHNILETGIQELDNIITKILPENEWFITSALNEQKRTLSGLFFRNKLHTNTSFLDLRDYPQESRYKFLQDLITTNYSAFKPENPKLISAYEYAEAMFGKSLTKDVISKVLYNIFGQDATKLNSMTLLLLGFNRICLLDEDDLMPPMDNKIISSRLCFPNQRDVPTQYLSSAKAYYPKNFGMYRIIDALEKKLLENTNVSIHKNSTIDDMIIENNNISSVTINNQQYTDIKHIISSTNLNTLSNMLHIDNSDLSYDSSLKTVLVNILIDKPLAVGDLSYVYCYDAGFLTFRIDNYYNYCGDGAIRDGAYPITMELLSYDISDTKKLKQTALKELKMMNVLAQDATIKFAEVEVLDYGFPLLSQNNIKTIDTLRERIDKLEIDNLIKIGILSKKELFFEGEIKVDLFHQLKNLER